MRETSRRWSAARRPALWPTSPDTWMRRTRRCCALRVPLPPCCSRQGSAKTRNRPRRDGDGASPHWAPMSARPGQRPRRRGSESAMSRVDTAVQQSDAGETLAALVALGAGEPHRRRPQHLLWHRDDEPRARYFAPAMLATASALVALWPYTAVISPGGWSITVVIVVLTVTLVGAGVRALLRYRRGWVREITALAAQVLASIGMLTMMVAGDTAVFGLVPTESSMRTFGALGASAWEQVGFGSAPLDSTPALRMIMGVGFAILTILLDQLIAVRGAVLASLLIASVGAVPMIVTLGDANVVWFVMLAVMVLLLFRTTAGRNPDAPRRASALTTISAGAAAVVAALVVAPVVP